MTVETLTTNRPEFIPPSPKGTARALILALIAHALLIAALTWGVQWRRDSENMAVEAELWSSTVQQAAPPAVRPPAEHTPSPPRPPQPQAVRPPAPAATPAQPQPDIALERQKKLREEKERREREETERKRAEEKKELEARKRQQEEAERKEIEQRKLAEQKHKAAAAQAAKDRQAQLDRLLSMAAGNGSANSTGTAARSAGPSGSYPARIAAAVRPNVVYSDAEISNANPRAEFDVRLASDGTIISVKLSRPSGVPAWDEAAERALRKTGKLPPDIDGRFYQGVMTIGLRPKD